MNTSSQDQKCAIWKWPAGCNYCTKTIDKCQHSEKLLYSRKNTLVELLFLQRKDLDPILKGKCWAKKELKTLWKDNRAGSTLGFPGEETFYWGKASFRLTEEAQSLDFKEFSQHLEVTDWILIQEQSPLALQFNSVLTDGSKAPGSYWRQKEIRDLQVPPASLESARPGNVQITIHAGKNFNGCLLSDDQKPLKTPGVCKRSMNWK